MDFEEEDTHYLRLKAKRKNQNYLPKFDCLELKPRTRQGKCVGAASEFFKEPVNNLPTDSSNNSSNHIYISNDIWFHLARYIVPEDVQNFALICRQSANSINFRGFWLQLYWQYCQQSSDEQRILQLPAILQMHQIKNCDKNTVRQSVIRALFFCYEPFKKRLKENYKLKSLEGRTFISFWYKEVQCVWRMCYKFKHNFALIKNNAWLRTEKEEVVVDNWESLADDDNKNAILLNPYSSTDDVNGISLLVIYCARFEGPQYDLLYNNSRTQLRLANTRELLSTDMRSKHLELDFISATKTLPITVKYLDIQKYTVIPWWHPDFRIFCESE